MENSILTQFLTCATFNRITKLLDTLEEKIYKEIDSMNRSQLLSYYKEINSLNNNTVFEIMHAINAMSTLTKEQKELLILFNELSEVQQKILINKLKEKLK